MAVDPQAPNGKNEEGMFLIVVLVCNYRMSFTVSEGPNFCQIFPFFQIVTLGLSAYWAEQHHTSTAQSSHSERYAGEI